MTAHDCERKEEIDLAQTEGMALSAADRGFVAAHLAVCDDCRLEAAALAALRYHDGDASHFPMDELSRARVVEQVLDQVDEPAAEATVAAETSRVWRVAIAAGVAAVVAIGALIGARLLDGGAFVGQVLLAAGDAQAEHGRLALGQTITQGQILETGAGEVSFRLPTGITVLLEENSRVHVAALSPEQIELELAAGVMSASVDPQRKGPRFGVETRSGRVEITGTLFSLTDGAEAELKVLHGSVKVSEPGRSSRMVKGSQASRLGSGQTRALSQADEKVLLGTARRFALLEEEETVRVQIGSVPNGARVRLNGEIVGHTPFAANVAPGSYELEVSTLSVEGLVVVRERLDLAAGHDMSRSYTLDVEEPARRKRK